MDADRFDALARTLAAPGSRRRALAGLLGGAVALLGPTDAAAGAATKRCKQIEDRKRRRACLARGRRRPRGDTGSPPPPPPPPPPCAGKPDDAPCHGDGRCRNGACNPRPTCGGYQSGDGRPCDAVAEAACCSGACDPVFGSACLLGNAGRPCRASADCAATCVGYVCT